MARLAIAVCAASPWVAQNVADAQVDIGSGLRVATPRRSMIDMRDENVVKQRYDFSCGAAALATILRYGFGDDVTELMLLEELFELLSTDEQESARRTGFSLLHLQRVAQARGYSAEGFRLSPHQLAMLGGPVLVYIEPRGYAHFAVLRAVRGGRVYLADPSRGNIRMPLYQFLDSWLQDGGTGIIFAVEPSAAASRSPGKLWLTEELGVPEVVTARELLGVGSFEGLPPDSLR